ncbi:MAG: flagellar hook-length control protein FliK [Candidatus Krumholzibacteriota bacterium]|nr:flagellar hook-length control protein FliK [Candidatus Krumholzibacteriota bacterium]
MNIVNQPISIKGQASGKKAGLFAPTARQNGKSLFGSGGFIDLLTPLAAGSSKLRNLSAGSLKKEQDARKRSVPEGIIDGKLPSHVDEKKICREDNEATALLTPPAERAVDIPGIRVAESVTVEALDRRPGVIKNPASVDKQAARTVRDDRSALKTAPSIPVSRRREMLTGDTSRNVETEKQDLPPGSSRTMDEADETAGMKIALPGAKESGQRHLDHNTPKTDTAGLEQRYIFEAAMRQAPRAEELSGIRDRKNAAEESRIKKQVKNVVAAAPRAIGQDAVSTAGQAASLKNIDAEKENRPAGNDVREIKEITVKTDEAAGNRERSDNLIIDRHDISAAQLSSAKSAAGKVHLPVQVAQVISVAQSGIVEQIVHLGPAGGSSEISIRLDPPELGEMKIKVRMDGKKVEAEIIVDSLSVKNIINSDTARLSEAISQEGYVLENLDVSVEDPGHGGRSLFQEEDVVIREETARKSPRQDHRGQMNENGINILV